MAPSPHAIGARPPPDDKSWVGKGSVGAPAPIYRTPPPGGAKLTLHRSITDQMCACARS